MGGLRLIWTAALPDALLHSLTQAGLLDIWLLFDLLAASGVLGALSVAALATGARALAATLLAAIAVPSLAAVVAGLSLAAMTAGLSTLTFGYGAAYSLAAALTHRKSRAPAVQDERGLTLTR